ncbi:ABC transporter permease [Cognatilysobacter terrigena]|uniref:ABC transporter permease n=1 Tax=Cognatilysobacter terrigena TaxID=2488749 RepID=UPI001FEA68FF|nr:ABC transporter permease [Lysobacter terrigena]
MIGQLTQREVVGRYRGSMMGVAWSFLHPLLMLAVYTFVFSVVFRARWPGVMAEQGRARFALMLFIGVIAHGLVAEAITKAPALIVGNASYVKKVVFPLEALVWSLVGSATFHAVVSLSILLLVKWTTEHWVPVTAWWLPVTLFPLVMFSLGIAWLFAALGAFLRDIGQLAGLLATILMFMAPVFYPIASLPEPYRAWIQLNPLTVAIEQSRRIVFDGLPPDFKALGIYYIAAFLAMACGYAVFQKLRRGFADVL